MASHKLYWISHAVVRSLFDQLLIGEVEGLENIPRRGACILAANHCSHLDPPLTGCRILRRLTFFARKTLWKPGIAAWWLDGVGTIPVDRDGESDVSALKRTLLTLQQGGLLTLFPEGTRSPDGSLQEPKPGIGLIAARSQAMVIPCRIFNSHLVLSRKSKLPNLRTRIHIVYGQPIPPSQYDPGREAGKQRYQTIARRIMDRIAQLKRPRPRVI